MNGKNNYSVLIDMLDIENNVFILDSEKAE